MPRPLNQTETDLNADNLLRLPAEFGCPVWVYDAQIVREKIAALHQRQPLIGAEAVRRLADWSYDIIDIVDR